MQEIWKDIKGYEGKYQVSNYGKIKSLNYKRTGNERIMKEYPSIKGYSRTCLCKNNKVKFHLIHRLVAEAFIPNPRKCLEINHKNGVKTDNRVDNLEWCTRLENVRHSLLNNFKEFKYGENNPTSSIIYQIDIKTNKIINVFYGCGDIKRRTDYKNPTSILKCCKNRKNYKTAYGYKWEYAKGGDKNV